MIAPIQTTSICGNGKNSTTLNGIPASTHLDDVQNGVVNGSVNGIHNGISKSSNDACIGASNGICKSLSTNGVQYGDSSISSSKHLKISENEENSPKKMIGVNGQIAVSSS